MIQARWQIEVLPYVGTTKDEYGNEVESWATTPRREMVYGWSPAGINENNASRHTVVSDIQLLVPPGFRLDSRDRVRILGVTYEVQGGIEDYNHGPFGFAPGGQVNLRKFE